MRRTAESIEEAKEAHRDDSKQKQKSKNPDSRKPSGKKRTLPEAARPFMFKPGQSGNPGGRPKNDLAKEIAKAVFENNPDIVQAAFIKALRKGNAYVFKELADRAYGKVKETIEHTGEVDLTLNDVRQRITELLDRRK